MGKTYSLVFWTIAYLSPALVFSAPSLQTLCERVAFADFNLLPLEERLGYVFQNPDLKTEALTFRGSYAQRIEGEIWNNERMEFLGDSVFNLFMWDVLIARYPEVEKPILYKGWEMLISNQGQAQLADLLQLKSDIIYKQKYLELPAILPFERVLSNTLEALVGAVYLDGGSVSAKLLIERFFNSFAHKELMGFSAQFSPVTKKPLAEMAIPEISALPAIPNSQYAKYYTRLKFLGRHIVYLAVAEILIQQYPLATERQLSGQREFLMSFVNHSKQWLRHIPEEIAQVLRPVLFAKDNRLHHFQFLLGLVYLTEGYIFAKKIVQQVVNLAMLEWPRDQNYKNFLDKVFLIKFHQRPAYKIEQVVGRSQKMDRMFVATVLFNGRILGQGQAETKRKALRVASVRIIHKLGILPPVGLDFPLGPSI